MPPYPVTTIGNIFRAIDHSRLCPKQLLVFTNGETWRIVSENQNRLVRKQQRAYAKALRKSADG